MEGYLYRHKINPAQYAYKDYMALVLGDVSAGVNSGFGLQTFLYPKDGQVYTFLNNRVSEQEFLSRIRANNLLSANVSVDLFSLGVLHDSRAFSSLNFGLRGGVVFNLPRDLFRFMKTGTVNGDTFSLQDMDFRARLYAEASYGLSYPIGKRLRVGAKVKVLFGLASAKIDLETFDMKINGQEISVNAKASMVGDLGPISLGWRESENVPGRNVIDFSSFGFDLSGFRVNGMGFGVDLGATFDVLPWIQLSAAILDLGRMRWDNGFYASMAGNYKFEGLQIDVNSTETLGEQLEAEKDKLLQMFEFGQVPGYTGTQSAEWLPATVNVGAQVFLPFWKALSAGLLVTHHFEWQFSWTEARASVNVAPVSFFGLGLSYAYSSFGSSLGAAVHLQLPLLAIFVAAEAPGLRFTPKYSFSHGTMPLNFPLDNLNITTKIGITMTFGPRYAKRFRVEKKPWDDEYM